MQGLRAAQINEPEIGRVGDNAFAETNLLPQLAIKAVLHTSLLPSPPPSPPPGCSGERHAEPTCRQDQPT